MNTVEGNKIIAEFMGEDYGYTDKGWKDRCGFHTSWDWLMPVVEKIESIKFADGYCGVHISSNECTLQHTKFRPNILNSQYHYWDTITHDTKIKATWEAIVAFIEWYKTIQS